MVCLITEANVPYIRSNIDIVILKYLQNTVARLQINIPKKILGESTFREIYCIVNNCAKNSIEIFKISFQRIKNSFSICKKFFSTCIFQFIKNKNFFSIYKNIFQFIKNKNIFNL